MPKLRVGINGVGRIGRTILREYLSRKISDFEIVALNDLGDLNVHTHLLKFDSVHGTFPGEVKYENGNLHIDGKTLKFYSHKDPSQIPWADNKIDIVIDSTGIFKDKEGLGLHRRGTVQKVIMCAPGKGLDGTFVMGINHQTYDAKKHNIISNASCTTNCLAPVAKVLHERWGIENGFMLTVHAYTSDQTLLDGYHSDVRRGRAASLSMIPTTTGAAKSVGEVIPELKGKLDGYAVRVPTPDVSMVDFTAILKKAASKDEINAAMKEASETSLKGILAYNNLELVSQDFIRNRHSSIFDATLTNVIGNTAKVVAWYDNEIGFSNRVLDLAAFIGAKL
ncbi:MAG: type I glyceraldehyde-3-phosphate dehydrogenase [Bdellovibrionales bacterium GWA2_49_15]|nr:MAG: type I glyceraldehyde-3-phosphate dehydrogenase [Bdellovibrionales bacterium GWA2_49_15]HAZ11863.1 type I glyceraldehyde-3-phosphate dehydrogenase [Bdellovibrionales bacterium]